MIPSALDCVIDEFLDLQERVIRSRTDAVSEKGYENIHKYVFERSYEIFYKLVRRIWQGKHVTKNMRAVHGHVQKMKKGYESELINETKVELPEVKLKTEEALLV